MPLPCRARAAHSPRAGDGLAVAPAKDAGRTSPGRQCGLSRARQRFCRLTIFDHVLWLASGSAADQSPPAYATLSGRDEGREGVAGVGGRRSRFSPVGRGHEALGSSDQTLNVVRLRRGCAPLVRRRADVRV